MTLQKILWPALAIAALAAPLSAQAAPVHYVFDADATGTFNGAFSGPVHGSFTVEPSKFGNQYTYMIDGSQFHVQDQFDYEGYSSGMVKWALYEASGRSWNQGSVTRTLRPDGSSELTIASSDIRTRGESYKNLFKITYFSATDVLFTDRSADLSSILQADRASGIYDLYHSYLNNAGLPMLKQNYLTFNVTTTAVPEPQALAFVLAGLAVWPFLRARVRSEIRG